MSDDATKGMEGSLTWWLLVVALRMLARYCGTKAPLIATVDLDDGLPSNIDTEKESEAPVR